MAQAQNIPTHLSEPTMKKGSNYLYRPITYSNSLVQWRILLYPQKINVIIFIIDPL